MQHTRPCYIVSNIVIIRQLFEKGLSILCKTILDLPPLTSQRAIVGSTDSQSENLAIINHLLLTFKHYIFKSRRNKHLSFLQLKTDIIKVKNLEEDLSNGDNNKSKTRRKIWQTVGDIFV